jgi:hypothetical protein
LWATIRREVSRLMAATPTVGGGCSHEEQSQR